MRGTRKLCVAALCGVMLIMSACGSISNEVSDADDIKAEHITLERVDGTSADASISEEAYDECQEYIEDIYTEIGEYDERAYANDGDISAAIEKVAKLAEVWEKDGIAKKVTKHEAYVYIEFANGIKYFFAPATPGTSAVGGDTHVSVYSLQPAKAEFAARNEETKTADDNATDVAAKKIAETYDNYEWEYDLDDKELTIQTVMGFGSYEVILWNGHGGWFEECGSTLVLSETIADIRYDGDIRYIINDGRYLITSDFVDAYISDLTNTFLYFSTCSGLRDTGLAESFKNKGAAAIVGNTDVITTIYTSNIMSAVVDGLLDGKDLDSAMASAKEIYGSQDPELYEEEGALGYAVPTVYWGGDYTFSETGFADGEYQTNKTDNQNGYCDNVITADAEGNRTSAAGFYEAFIQDGYLHINGGIALHSWEPRNHIVKFYPYSEYQIELADSCYYEETFVGEIPAEVRTADEMNHLLQQAKTIDQLTIEISNGEITKMSFSGWEE